MSRKLVLGLAAIATLLSAALVAVPANARAAGHGGHGAHGGHGGHRPPHVRPHNPHRHHVHRHHHWRYVWRHGHYYPVGYVAPVAAPGPCTCLWKGYTPEGSVVFKDLCTQEMASAPVAGAPAQASEIQAPGNFAGRSYKDYLAANPQAVPAAPQKN
jgi:hypothetical protein